MTGEARPDVNDSEALSFNQVFARLHERPRGFTNKIQEGLHEHTFRAPSEIKVFKDCSNCTLTVSGRGARLILEDCVNTQVKFDSLVSSLEIIRSSDISVSWRQNGAPSITVDNSQNLRIVEEPEANKEVGHPKLWVIGSSGVTLQIRGVDHTIPPAAAEDQVVCVYVPASSTYDVKAVERDKYGGYPF